MQPASSNYPTIRIRSVSSFLSSAQWFKPPPQRTLHLVSCILQQPDHPTIRLPYASSNLDLQPPFQSSILNFQSINASSAFAILRHCDDDISLFASCFHIAVRLGGLFQRITSIDDRSDPPRLNQLFEENKVFRLFAG